MSLRIWALGASLGLAALFSAGSAMATPLLIIGCTVNQGGLDQTCNFYETDANGNSSEISSPVTNQIAGSYWHVGYSAINDPDGTLSDIIIWNPISPGSALANTGTLY